MAGVPRVRIRSSVIACCTELNRLVEGTGERELLQSLVTAFLGVMAGEF